MLLLASLLPVSAQAAGEECEVTFTNGNVVRGTVIESDASRVILLIPHGKLKIRKEEIREIRVVEAGVSTPEEVPTPAKATPPSPVPPEVPEKVGRTADPGPKPAITPPSTTPLTAVDETIKTRVDDILQRYRKQDFPLTGKPLIDRLVKLGKEAVPYYVVLVEKGLEQKHDTAEGKPETPFHELVGAIGAIKDERGLPLVIALMKSENVIHRRWAANALPSFRTPKAVVTLVEALEELDTHLKESLVKAVVTVARETPDIDVRRMLTDSFGKSGKSAIGIVLCLIEIGVDDTVRLFEPYTYHHDEDIRTAALYALSKLAPKEAARFLRLALQDQSSSIRKMACSFLGLQKEHRAVHDLIALLEDPDGAIAESAHWALKEITGEALMNDLALWKTWWDEVGKTKYAEESSVEGE